MLLENWVKGTEESGDGEESVIEFQGCGVFKKEGRDFYEDEDGMKIERSLSKN